MKDIIIKRVSRFITALMLTATVISCAQAGDKSNAASLPQVEFDPTYEEYAQILKAFVVGDRVDYAGLTKSREKLERVVAAFASAVTDSVEAMSNADKIAFYINAYNATTLLSIVERYPVKSIKDIGGVWKKRKWIIAGRELTINDIEHEILRKMGEPRIHFAINCASISCPPLYSSPYSGDSLDSQLDAATRTALADETRANYMADKKELKVSKIFDWFGKDFELIADEYARPTGKKFSKRDSAVIAFVAYYFNEETRETVLREAQKLSHLSYDWDLNDVKRDK